MGGKYCQIYKHMDTDETNLYDVLRNGTTHEFDPKLSYKIIINPKPKPDLCGIECINLFLLRINLNEYLRDLKKSYQKWKQELQNDMSTGKWVAAVDIMGYSHPPQGGLGTITHDGEEYIIKTSNGISPRGYRTKDGYFKLSRI